MLVAARFVQGVGGAFTSAVILGMIVTLFPRPDEQAKAIGVFSFVAAAGASIGLLAGGVLTEALSWHWIFFVNVPIGIVTGVLARAPARPRGRHRPRPRRRRPGALLIVGALMLAVYTIVEVPENGWGSAADARPRRRRASPCSPGSSPARRRPRSRSSRCGSSARATSTTANLVQMLLVAGMLGMFFLGALYLQRVLGYGALDVGLAFLPVALGIATLSLGVSARLILRFGGRATLVAGPRARSRRAPPVLARAGRRHLRARPAARDAPPRHRRRARVPRADHARDVRRHAERVRPRLGPVQHDRSRSAPRSASRCSRRCRRRAPRACARRATPRRPP